jgi:hypothetical protein
MRDTTAAAAGGWALIAAAAAFTAVFSYLAASFGYPAVLDGDAATVLPRLLSLGATGRAVWGLYGVLPLLLIPAGVGAYAALGSEAPGRMRVAAAFAGLAALAMTLGLLRWPSIHWSLATSYAAATSDAERRAIASVFDGLNSFLGNFVGEFVGELALNLFFLLTALASWRSARVPRWSAPAGVAAALLGLVAMWRNVTPAVAWVSDIENAVLPLWMIVLGVLLVRSTRSAPDHTVREQGVRTRLEGARP